MERGLPGSSFDVTRVDDGREATRLVVDAVVRHGRAVPALVRGGAHWVAVIGVETDGEPGPADDSYEIRGLYVNDPVHHSVHSHARNECSLRLGPSMGFRALHHVFQLAV